MLRSVKEIKGTHVRAEDGQVGGVEALYFDDEDWRVRHLVVGAGNILTGRDVLLSSEAVRAEDASDGRAFVLRSGLSRGEIENAPGAVTDPPVAVQREIERAATMPYPATDNGVTGPAGAPSGPNTLDETGWLAPGPGEDRGTPESGEPQGAPRLRSTKEVAGYRVRGEDGGIGHVEDFVVDTEGWTVRYLAVDTKNWLPGKTVLVAAPWVMGVSWEGAEVSVDLNSIEVKEAPAWNPDAPVDRAHEEELHAHYGRAPYWAAGGG